MPLVKLLGNFLILGIDSLKILFFYCVILRIIGNNRLYGHLFETEIIGDVENIF